MEDAPDSSVVTRASYAENTKGHKAKRHRLPARSQCGRAADG